MSIGFRRSRKMHTTTQFSEFKDPPGHPHSIDVRLKMTWNGAKDLELPQTYSNFSKQLGTLLSLEWFYGIDLARN